MSSDHPAELDRAVAVALDSDEQRVEMLRRITNRFLADADRSQRTMRWAARKTA